MQCLMCFNDDCELQKFDRDTDDNLLKQIMFILPDFAIRKKIQNLVYICATCIQQVDSFYSLKKSSLENLRLLNNYKDLLKETSVFDLSVLKIIINNDKVAAKCKPDIELQSNRNRKNLKTLENEDVPINREKEYNCNQQLVNNKSDSISPTNGCSSNDKQKPQLASKEKRFACCGCQRTFSYPSDLKRHSRIHSSKRPYKCSKCPKTFARFDYLTAHKRIHITIKPYRCDICSKQYATQSLLNSHIRVHNRVRNRAGNKEQRYKCETCEKTYVTASYLAIHNRIHTGEKPHECDICHKAFTQSSSLNNHKQRIHNDARPYQCSVCDKTFKRPDDLMQHLRIHAEEKRYKCHICEYKCTQSGHLQVHLRTHTGNKPYNCKHCKRSFNQLSHYKEHQIKYHDEQSN